MRYGDSGVGERGKNAAKILIRWRRNLARSVIFPRAYCRTLQQTDHFFGTALSPVAMGSFAAQPTIDGD